VFNLYFGNLFSILTTALVVIMLVFIIIFFNNQKRIQHWGWHILSFILIGTAISGLSAIRDAYMTEAALFVPESMQSLVCSVAGGLIFLTGLVAIFVRKQEFRKIGYFIIAVLFVIQVITIEISRIAML